MARTRLRLKFTRSAAPSAIDTSLTGCAFDAVAGTPVGTGTVIDADSPAMTSITCSNAKYEIANIVGKTFEVRLSAAGAGNLTENVDETTTFTATDTNGLSYTTDSRTIPVTGGEVVGDTFLESVQYVASGTDLTQDKWHKFAFAPALAAAVEPTETVVVKIGETECLTQLDEVTNDADDTVKLGVLWVLVPSGTWASGANTVSFYKRTDSRENTNLRTMAEIAALDIYVQITDLERYGGTGEGSGTWRATVADVVESGGIYTMTYAQGKVGTGVMVRVPFKDTVGGATHPTLFCEFDIQLLNNADESLRTFKVGSWALQGDYTASSTNANGRYYSPTLYVDGVAVLGHAAGEDAAKDTWHPYYYGAPLFRANGKYYWDDTDAEPQGYTVLDVAALGQRGWFPNLRTKKVNSNDPILTPITAAYAVSVTGSGSNQGAINIPAAIRNNIGTCGAVMLTFDSAPTGAEQNKAYWPGPQLSGAVFKLYPTQADSIAQTNPVIPDTGSISTGSNVRVQLASTPATMGTVTPGWSSTGERNELGQMSNNANSHRLNQNPITAQQIRVNALGMWRQQVHLRNPATLRVPDIITNSATYAGLGTGQRARDMRDWVSAQQPVNTGGTNIYTRTDPGQKQTSFEHIPSPDYFWMWFWEPEWCFRELMMSWGCGVQMVVPNGSPFRTRTYNGATCYASIGPWNNNGPRADACAIMTSLVPTANLPDAVYTGTLGERDMFREFESSNVALIEGYIAELQANAPNAYAAGRITNQYTNSGAVTWQNWMCGKRDGSFVSIGKRIGNFDWSNILAFEAKGAKAMAGIDPPGDFDPYLMSMYYGTNGASFTVSSPNPLDMPATQWGSVTTIAPNAGTLSIDATANTISFRTANKPTNTPSGAFYSNGDMLWIWSFGPSPVFANLPFNTPLYMDIVSQTQNGNSLDVVTRVSTSPGGSTFDIVGTTITNATIGLHPTTIPAYGRMHYNPIYYIQTSMSVFALAYWDQSDTDLQAAEAACLDRLQNIQGDGLEPFWGALEAKYAWLSGSAA